MKNPVRSSLVLLALVFLTIPSGCMLLSHPAPPIISLAHLQLAEVKLVEQKFRVGLRVQNPNSFELHVEGVDCELFVNDKRLATGVYGKSITIPPYGNEIVEVEAFSDLVSALRQLGALEKSNLKGLPYRVRGHVRLTKGGVRLPFDLQGDVPLGGKRNKEKRPPEPTPGPAAPPGPALSGD